MTVYADSSFIAALYVPGGVDPVPILLLVGEVPLPFNAVHRLEVRNTIRRRMPHNEAVRLLGELDQDIGEAFVHQPLRWTDVFRRAEEISSRYTAQTRIRAYDLFHLAAAVDTGHDTLLTFDAQQAATARLMGLTVHGA